ncbi:unnamed protein product [Lepeophtheirus salmonis]|uniref:(salmon louse) hypothetical protein n=1 Tax=Lepeophtheirus salmonis TaxID=72036 RepID=A0A7R8H0Q2_LEPSM|nr:unnamed protein product [Lepeophtheirus salmonis]CAF2773329.1 unnamed protein product [Lepeophtheirus salmonis]
MNNVKRGLFFVLFRITIIHLNTGESRVVLHKRSLGLLYSRQSKNNGDLLLRNLRSKEEEDKSGPHDLETFSGRFNFSGGSGSHANSNSRGSYGGSESYSDSESQGKLNNGGSYKGSVSSGGSGSFDNSRSHSSSYTCHGGCLHGESGGGEPYSSRRYDPNKRKLSSTLKWSVGTSVIFLVVATLLVIVICCYRKHCSTVSVEDDE